MAEFFDIHYGCKTGWVFSVTGTKLPIKFLQIQHPNTKEYLVFIRERSVFDDIEPPIIGDGNTENIKFLLPGWVGSIVDIDFIESENVIFVVEINENLRISIQLKDVCGKRLFRREKLRKLRSYSEKTGQEDYILKEIMSSGGKDKLLNNLGPRFEACVMAIVREELERQKKTEGKNLLLKKAVQTIFPSRIEGPITRTTNFCEIEFLQKGFRLWSSSLDIKNTIYRQMKDCFSSIVGAFSPLNSNPTSSSTKAYLLPFQGADAETHVFRVHFSTEKQNQSFKEDQRQVQFQFFNGINQKTDESILKDITQVCLKGLIKNRLLCFHGVESKSSNLEMLAQLYRQFENDHQGDLKTTKNTITKAFLTILLEGFVQCHLEDEESESASLGSLHTCPHLDFLHVDWNSLVSFFIGLRNEKLMEISIENYLENLVISRRNTDSPIVLIVDNLDASKLPSGSVIQVLENGVAPRTTQEDGVTLDQIENTLLQKLSERRFLVEKNCFIVGFTSCEEGLDKVLSKSWRDFFGLNILQNDEMEKRILKYLGKRKSNVGDGTASTGSFLHTVREKLVKKLKKENQTIAMEEENPIEEDMRENPIPFVGYTAVKESMFKNILNPFLHPHLYREIGLSKIGIGNSIMGVILAGRSGSGKTHLCKWLVQELKRVGNAQVCEYDLEFIQPTEVLSQFVGESEKKLEVIFNGSYEKRLECTYRVTEENGKDDELDSNLPPLMWSRPELKTTAKQTGVGQNHKVELKGLKQSQKSKNADHNSAALLEQIDSILTKKRKSKRILVFENIDQWLFNPKNDDGGGTASLYQRVMNTFLYLLDGISEGSANSCGGTFSDDSSDSDVEKNLLQKVKQMQIDQAVADTFTGGVSTSSKKVKSSSSSEVALVIGTTTKNPEQAFSESVLRPGRLNIQINLDRLVCDKFRDFGSNLSSSTTGEDPNAGDDQLYDQLQLFIDHFMDQYKAKNHPNDLANLKEIDRLKFISCHSPGDVKSVIQKEMRTGDMKMGISL